MKRRVRLGRTRVAYDPDMLLATLNDAVIFAQSTYRSSGSANPVGVLFGVVVVGLFIYLAYKCASNGHLILFVLGFLFPILWIIGTIIGKRRKY